MKSDVRTIFAINYRLTSPILRLISFTPSHVVSEPLQAELEFLYIEAPSYLQGEP